MPPIDSLERETIEARPAEGSEPLVWASGPLVGASGPLGGASGPLGAAADRSEPENTLSADRLSCLRVAAGGCWAIDLSEQGRGIRHFNI